MKANTTVQRTRARYAAQTREALEPLLRLLVVRKFALIKPESAGVIVAPPIDQTCRMFNVQHLVIQDVLDKPLRNFG